MTCFSEDFLDGIIVCRFFKIGRRVIHNLFYILWISYLFRFIKGFFKIAAVLSQRRILRLSKDLKIG